MNSPTPAVFASGVRKHYTGGAEGAGLNGFDLEVRAGTVCGLLGPNGAGKTTAIKILATLLALDAGQARVAGFNVVTEAALVRQHIGLVGQYAAIDEILTCRQNLMLFGRLNHVSGRAARQRADHLLEQFDLVAAANIPASKLSGGMRRRLDLAVSLIVSPQVLFVDEPTTGLDPAGRLEVWEAIRTLVREGTTVLLTTQYLDEADQLADRISMLKAGRVIAEGTPEDLKSAFGTNWLDIVVDGGANMDSAKAILQPFAAGELHIDAESRRISIPVQDRIRTLTGVTAAFADAQIALEDLSLRRPTLDEVFLHLNSSVPTNRQPEVA